MFSPISTFSGFSVRDLGEAKEFYGDKLGLSLTNSIGGIKISLPRGGEAWFYAKEDHQPSSYTILNFVVSSIDEAIDDLKGKGIKIEFYPGSPQNKKGIMPGKAMDMGPDIAWFKDPSGNILSVLEH
jgi:catechol 2,3-dioxygenase-like lactoylglutathione lyase family enzyme